MTYKTFRIALTAIPATLISFSSSAQSAAGDIHSLQSVLDELYDDMVPLCNQLIGVAQGIAGFAALWYIASRVWRSIANAEPIDFYPLLRPFALGLSILLFPYVLSMINSILKPTVTGTAAMMKNSNNAIAYLLKQREEVISKTPIGQTFVEGGTEKWLEYTYLKDESPTATDFLTSGMEFLMAKAALSVKYAIKQWLSEILQILYEAAALCINTLRTFYLIVLAILGPLVFGLSVFDGLQSTLIVWISRYINVFLWLPVANIFGSIIARVQENMLRNDIEQIIEYGDTYFSSTDSAYLIFLIIAIIGYFTVPSVANYIVHAGGTNTLLSKSTNFFTRGVAMLFSSSGESQNTSDKSSSGKDQNTNAPNTYMNDKLSGKS